MTNEHQVKALNKLIATCYDGEKGYKEAAEDTEAQHLLSMFNDFSKQRYDFGHELKTHIRNLGGEVEKGTTLGADIHRLWIDLKSSLSSKDDKAVLEEVKRGEEHALDNYNEALDNLEPGSPAFNTVVEQRNKIRTAVERVNQLIPVYANG